MRWYDYFACLWFADMIAAGLASYNFIYLATGLLSYYVYEGFRKDPVTK